MPNDSSQSGSGKMFGGRPGLAILCGVIGILGLAMVLLLGSRIGATNVDAGWWLTEPPTGASFDITIDVSSSSCVSHDRVDVQERNDRVVVVAYNTVTGDGSCTLDYRELVVEVELDEPLGTRRLIGCVGIGESIPITGPAVPSDADCSNYIKPSRLGPPDQAQLDE